MSRKAKRPRELIAPCADMLEAELKKLFAKVQVCGSVRRGEPLVGDIDLVVTGKLSDQKLDDFMECLGAVTEEPNHVGPRSPYSIVFNGQKIFFDVWVVPEDRFGAATMYATGSGPFNVVMRRWAIFHGLKLFLTGVYDKDDKLLAGATEEDCFNALGWDFVPPAERSFPMSRKHTFKYSAWMNRQESL